MPSVMRKVFKNSILGIRGNWGKGNTLWWNLITARGKASVENASLGTGQSWGLR